MSMQSGVIAIVDILGFKGMWRGPGAEAVLNALQDARARIEDLAHVCSLGDGGDLWEQLAIETWLLSDSIMIISTVSDCQNASPVHPELEHMRRYMHLRQVVLMLTRFVTDAIQGTVPFRYRGCIAYGDFQKNDFAAVGPAVDEAGGLFEAAEGAFVFLAPSAVQAFRVRPGLMGLWLPPYFVKYTIPLKAEQVLDTYALNLLLLAEEQSQAEVKSTIVSQFEPAASVSADIRKKRDNTQAFLDFLENDWNPPGGWLF